MLAARAADADKRVADAIEAAHQPSKGALRMRSYRERHAASRSVTCDAAAVTCDDSDAQVTLCDAIPAPAPFPLSSPHTPQQTPYPHPHPEGSDARTRKARSAPWPCPEGVDPAHWSDLLANRKSKRLANTATAHAGLLRDLAKLSDDEWPPGRIVQHAAERGWGAIFDPRPKHPTGSTHGHRDYSTRRSGNGMFDAVVDAERAERAGSGFRA